MRIDVPTLGPTTIGAYAFAFVSAVVAVAVRVAIEPYVVGVPFITFFPAIIITTLIGGFGAGLLCVVLTIGAVDFLSQSHLILFNHLAGFPALLLFLLVTLSSMILVEGMRFALGRYQKLSRELEQRVKDRDAELNELREHEEKEQLLMREVSHRAKNMFSVVEAIARHTATKNPADFVEHLSRRLRALSANQDLLVRNEWKGVEIEELVRAQLAHFTNLIGSRIVMQGCALRLNAASAQTIALAVYELATNASKYGALSTDTGHVNIYWRASGDRSGAGSAPWL
jgi:HWE histidine kinase